jgi:hypothetical protein
MFLIVTWPRALVELFRAMGCGKRRIWKFFSRTVLVLETAGSGALFKNWSGFFCGLVGLFFSAAEKPEKSKILGRQRGVPQKNVREGGFFGAYRAGLVPNCGLLE